MIIAAATTVKMDPKSEMMLEFAPETGSVLGVVEVPLLGVCVTAGLDAPVVFVPEAEAVPEAVLLADGTA